LLDGVTFCLDLQGGNLVEICVRPGIIQDLLGRGTCVIV
jgi:hypothetical protein